MKKHLTIGLALAVILSLLASVAALADTGPSISSDLPDYGPGDTVTLMGTGWQSGEAVHLFVNDNAGQIWSYNADVTAADDGTFSHSFQLPNSFVAKYNVTATGASSGIATTTFTDGSLQFVESGLPNGTDWSVTWNGVTQHSTTNSISFGGQLLIANFIVPNVGPYVPNPASGSAARPAQSNTQVNITFTAAKSYPVVSVTNSPVTYNGSPQAANVTGSVPGTVSNVKYNGSATVPTNVGTYAVTADFAPSDASQYNSLTGASAGSFAINQASSSVTVTCPSADQPYTGGAQTPCTASYSTSDGLTGSLSPSYSNNTNAGTATAAATFAGDANHAGSNNSGTFTISQATSSVTVTCPSMHEVYTGSAHTPCTASYSTSDGLSGALTVSYTDNINAGNVTASANYAGDSNHASSNGSAEFTIDKADAKCSVNGYTGVYDAAAHGASGSCAGIGDVDLSASLDLGPKFTNAPGGTAHWSFTGNGNYNDQSGDAAIAISKADATVNVSGYSGVYDAKAHSASGMATGVGGVDLSAWLDLGETFTNVPGGTAHWTFAGGTNYNDQAGDAAIVLTKANATCSISGYAGVYDAASHSASGSCSGIDGESAGTLDLGVSFKDVPGGTAHWTFAGNGNYNNQSGDAAIAISKADATCAVSGYTDVYDAAAHGASGSCSGIGGEAAGTLDLGATFKDVPGGPAHWVFTGNGNYNGQSGDVNITISKANADCEITGYTRVYDAAPHGATGSCSGIGGEDAGSLDLGTSFKDVPGGTAHWVFTGNGNYNNRSGDAAIEITQADATCSVSGYTGVYDTAAHGAAGSCSGIGGETAGTLNLGASFTNVPGGTAHWVFTGNNNYKDQSGDAAIAISKADATCSISGYTGVWDGNPHGASGSCSGIGGEAAGTLNLGASFTKVPGGTAHWVFTGNGNYNDQSGDVAILINAWTLNGFYQPVDMNGVYNTVKNGSTVPFKFEIFAGPTELTDVAAVKSFTYAQTACLATATTDDIETLATGGTTLRYDFTAGQFVYNWKTPATAGKCYRVTMTALDGSVLQAFFKLK